ncbi:MULTISPECIES: Fur family transcriptional regulator [Aurantimonas]|jgi:Fur family transcriptional regulator, zinc uptake regulator|uniref:Fur family transcriptional regulator n=1 Tax=Aurantimonas TaxID=182269 RepID=UPI0004258CC2|nr:Fur family transcriptional regulator [Aurantimonas coralicida]MDE0923125.1 Fur family transcriptional regulator [Aurantimonas coralicida]|tara:strand:- start:114 stop:527 length:414 start_codon:yes stop_codon:yes gene_type:complete
MSARPNLTRNQSLVFDTLDGADEPLSAYTILDRLRDEGFRAPLQVYRALDKLIDCGLIHRIDSRKAFVACTHPGEHHGSAMIAFGICESCARVWEFSDDVICERLQGWAESEGFRPVRTSIEINGRCAECSRNEAGT